MATGIRTSGLVGLIRNADAAGKATSKAVRDLVRTVGNRVTVDAEQRIAPLSMKTAGGFRPIVRRIGTVTVEQRFNKTTGKRPDWGGTQMTHGLLPAVDDQQDATQEDLEAVVAQVTAQFFA